MLFPITNTPLTIPGLTFWVNAFDVNNDSGATNPANGVAIATWKDKSGNALNFTQSTGANQPVFTSSAINGKPGIRFNGSSQYLELAYNALLNPASSTIFSVAQVTGGSGTFRSIIVSRSAPASLRGYNVYATDFNNLWQGWMGANATWAVSNSGVAATNNVPVIIDYAFVTGTQNIAINDGALTGIGTATYFQNTTRVSRIGAGTTETSASFFMFGDIGEILIYNRVLTNEERTAIKKDLGNKWGITS